MPLSYASALAGISETMQTLDICLRCKAMQALMPAL